MAGHDVDDGDWSADPGSCLSVHGEDTPRSTFREPVASDGIYPTFVSTDTLLYITLGHK